MHREPTADTYEGHVTYEDGGTQILHLISHSEARRLGHMNPNIRSITKVRDGKEVIIYIKSI